MERGTAPGGGRLSGHDRWGGRGWDLHDGDVTFTESEDVEEFLGGGSDSAGFVQVMKVVGLDRSVVARLDEVMVSMAPRRDLS